MQLAGHTESLLRPGADTADRVVIFAGWRFDRRIGMLYQRDDNYGRSPVAVSSRALQILAVLLRDPGALCSKDFLLDTVWPGLSVETNNLTVQISALRRVLDRGRDGESCIQTVPGRGYRLVCPVAPAEEPGAPVADPPPPEPVLIMPPAIVPVAQSWPRKRVAVSLGCGLAAVLVAAVAWRSDWRGSPAPAPQSLVVLPFENLSGQPAEDAIAAAITDDLNTELSTMSGGSVVSVGVVRKIGASGATAAQVGARFHVRYMLTGSVRRLDGVIRMNAQLVSTEDGVTLWSERLDMPSSPQDSSQDSAVRRVSGAVHWKLIEVAAARVQREHPEHPTATDLVTEAHAALMQPPTPEGQTRIVALYERALQLDPTSAQVKLGLASALVDDQEFNARGRKAVLERTTALVSSARATAPRSMWTQLDLLRWLAWQNERCDETIEMSREFIVTYPDTPQVYRWLGNCLIQAGHAEEAVPALQKAIAFADDGSGQANNYRNMGYAMLLLGRYDESIAWNRRALAANPAGSEFDRARLERRIAASLALSDHPEEARRMLAEANRLWPWATLRWIATPQGSIGTHVQLARMVDGLRLAGLRDHAEEAADFGTPSDGRLSQPLAGPTPTSVPGATMVLTADLVQLIGDRNPVVLDTVPNSTGRSLPGAVGLRYAGEGGTLTDIVQDHLRTKMQSLTHGDLATPIVAVGGNSERFDGRNLALRLAALGYRSVYWYRGGREAWEIQGLPETDLIVQDW